MKHLTNPIIAGAAGATLLGAIGFAASLHAFPNEEPPTRLADAATACHWAADTVTSDRRSLHVTSHTDDEILNVACIFDKLHAPTEVVEHMHMTRAIDGQQTDSWDGLRARWTYSGDASFTLSVTDDKANS